MDIPVRRRRKKKNNTKLLVLAFVCAVLLVALICFAIWLTNHIDDADSPAAPAVDGPAPALEITGLQEVGENVIVQTTYANLKHPFAFSDLIHVRTSNTDSVKTLHYYTVLSGGEYRLFDIIIGGTEGIRLGDITVPGRTSTLPVFAVIHDDGMDLDEENKNSYLATRDCFNDVVVSLDENKGYTSLR